MSQFTQFERTWFALLSDGTLAILGDHGDYEAADATATDLGYDAIWLVCGLDAAQWADAINSQMVISSSCRGCSHERDQHFGSHGAAQHARDRRDASGGSRRQLHTRWQGADEDSSRNRPDGRN